MKLNEIKKISWNKEMKIVMFQPFDKNRNEEKKIGKLFKSTYNIQLRL